MVDLDAELDVDLRSNDLFRDQQTHLGGAFDEAGSVVNIEFAHQIELMGLNCFDTE